MAPSLLSGPTSSFSRRDFIATAATTAGLLVLPSRVLGRDGTSPNSKLNIALVGIGGRGANHVRALGGRYTADENDDKGNKRKVTKQDPAENIVALCDVDQNFLDREAALYPEAKKYTDFRKMFEEMGSKIDAVVIATPDHTHYVIAMTAIKLGKHVYVEKPMTYSVWEARQLTLAARKYKVATQMGNQGHAGQGVRRVKEWIDAGVIGNVTTVHCWTDRPIWPQGVDRPKDEQAPPNLNWDLWLGPAAERPYGNGYHPFKWRGWLDFGCGALGDMACHIMDAAFWTLQLGAPTRIEASGTEVNNETFPKASIVTFHFPARGDKPPVKLYWYDGKILPPRPVDLEPNRNIGDNGSLIMGDKGTILTDCYSDSVRIVPESLMQELQKSKALPEKTIPNSPGVYAEWIEACKGGKPAGSNFDYAGPFTETVLLGTIALRCKKPIEWDSANLKISNLPEANALVKREARKGWDI